MNKIFILLLTALLSSCFTYHEVKNNDADIGIIDAIEADAEIVSGIAEIVSDELVKRKNDEKLPQHEGEDSNMCRGDEVKVCSLKAGCICKE